MGARQFIKFLRKTKDQTIKSYKIQDFSVNNNPYESWCDNEFFFKIKFSKYVEKTSEIEDFYE